MKTSKLKSIIALLLLSAVFFTACKKDKPAPDPQKEILGDWIGMYGKENGVPNKYYRFNIKPNGKAEVRTETNSIKGQANWTLLNNQLKLTYSYTNGFESFNILGTFDIGAKKISGKWGYGDSDPESGNFFLNKQ